MSSVFKKAGNAPGGSTFSMPKGLSGTKPWINGQVFASSGNKSFDQILGGGINLGSIVLIQEDRFSSHAKAFLNYCMAEGNGANQSIFVASVEGLEELKNTIRSLPLNVTKAHNKAAALRNSEKDISKGRDPHKIKQNIPRQGHNLRINSKSSPVGLSSSMRSSLTIDDTMPLSQASRDDKALRIAWQYKKYMKTPNTTSTRGSNAPQGKSNSSSSIQYCQNFDLSKHEVDEDLMKSRRVELCDLSLHVGASDILDTLLGSIKIWLQSEKVVNTVGRIMLPSIGSVLWGLLQQTNKEKSLLKFFYQLKMLISDKPVIAMVTTPSHLYPSALTARLGHIVDTVIRLDSFQGDLSYMKTQYKDLDGLFTIRKLPRLHSLACHTPDTDVFGIKRDRRSLLVERLHLPPEDGSTVNATSATGSKSSNLRTVPCASHGSSDSSLDF